MLPEGHQPHPGDQALQGWVVLAVGIGQQFGYLSQFRSNPLPGVGQVLSYPLFPLCIGLSVQPAYQMGMGMAVIRDEYLNFRCATFLTTALSHFV